MAQIISSTVLLTLQVLRWMGYFSESVPQSPAEDMRVRRIVVRTACPSSCTAPLACKACVSQGASRISALTSPCFFTTVRVSPCTYLFVKV